MPFKRGVARRHFAPRHGLRPQYVPVPGAWGWPILVEVAVCRSWFMQRPFSRANPGDCLTTNGFRFVRQHHVGLRRAVRRQPGPTASGAARTDFGETLAGLGGTGGGLCRGAVFRPPHERAFAGHVVDLVLNPVNYIFGPGVRRSHLWREAARRVLDSRYALGDTLRRNSLRPARISLRAAALPISAEPAIRASRGEPGGRAAENRNSTHMRMSYGDIFEE